MKITKFVHACLLVETEVQTILIDPGQFSWESGLFDVDSLDRIDTIVITHGHFDHFHQPFVEAVLQKFPDVQFVSTPTVVEKLREIGVQNTTSDSVESVEIFSRKGHADLRPLGEAPENIAVHIAGRLTVGGDRHDLEGSKDILALTVTAPWGSMMDAAAMAQNLKPKIIIPIHDWHWTEAARSSAYDRLESFFADQNITFLKPVDGQVFEV